MDGLFIYKIKFDFDDGLSLWGDAIQHVAASSPEKAQEGLKAYIDDMYDGQACIKKIHSIEKLTLKDKMVLVNENLLEIE